MNDSPAKVYSSRMREYTRGPSGYDAGVSTDWVKYTSNPSTSRAREDPRATLPVSRDT